MEGWSVNNHCSAERTAQSPEFPGAMPRREMWKVEQATAAAKIAVVAQSVETYWGPEGSP